MFLDAFLSKRARTLANLDSNRLQMDRMLSAHQIRAARSLLGWSRRELAIVAGLSQGTIKAIEQGETDARLSTLRKLARTFTAHGVEFVMDGARSGVVIKNVAKDHRMELEMSVRIPKSADPTRHSGAKPVRAHKTQSTGRAFMVPFSVASELNRTLQKTADVALLAL